MRGIMRCIIVGVMMGVIAVMVACHDRNTKPAEETAIPIPTPANTVPPRDISGDTTMAASIVYANSITNGVTASYTGAQRETFLMKNTTMQIEHGLLNTGERGVLAVKDFVGNKIIEDSMNVYVKMSDGVVQYDRDSFYTGRMNTTRLGYYYYETHIRDLSFGIADEKYEYIKTTDISNFKKGSWSSHMMSEPQYSNGTMTVTVNDKTDPYVANSKLNISHDNCNAIEVTFKVEGKADRGNLYFFTSETSNYNPLQQVAFIVIPDGNYHTYLIDLEATGAYSGDLQGVRFDIGSSQGDTITFKSVKAVKLNAKVAPFKIDKTFHLYSDKIHQEYRIIATGSSTSSSAGEEYTLEEYGLEVKILKSRVADYIVDKEAGFVAFDIITTGITGFIIPDDNRTRSFDVTEEGDYYVFRQIAAVPREFKEGDEFLFGNRLYNDFTHTYEAIRKAAHIERNPLTDNQVKVKSTNAGTVFIGYDMLRGMYHFTQKGTNFSVAYEREQNRYYAALLELANDESERNIYIWVNAESGGVECATITDDKGVAVPIPVEVCKNFKGEIEESFYDPDDTAYGDSIFPIYLKAEEKLEFNTMQLYQNWGIFPLKQISSIQFHISYYHLSTGVTESNCIAPYFVYGRDRWTLPDFRGCSGDMWTTQPQFNSVGKLRFLSYNKDGNIYASEYTHALLNSHGPVYADIDYSYISDCGSFEYTLRHFEYPQTDENRTYYTMELKVLEDLTIENAKENFTLFDMDGRSATFTKMSYLGENNQKVVGDILLDKPFSELYVLGKEHPFFSYYGVSGANASSIMNFAYIIRDYEIVIGGNKWDGNFVFRNSYDGYLNNGAISLNEDTLRLKAGDSMKINFILLPWGTHRDTTDPNVDYVLYDSAINPLKITAIAGTVVPDDYLMRIRCEDNTAEFTISGGRNNNAVRVDGFTCLGRPVIYERTDNGTYVEYDTSVEAFDGYQVSYNDDGTYSYSFVYTLGGSGSSGASRTFRISCL